MNSNEWVRKLTSRKFWAAVVGFVTALLLAFEVDAGSIEQVASIIMSFGSLIAYILAEGWADANNKKE